MMQPPAGEYASENIKKKKKIPQLTGERMVTVISIHETYSWQHCFGDPTCG